MHRDRNNNTIGFEFIIKHIVHMTETRADIVVFLNKKKRKCLLSSFRLNPFSLTNRKQRITKCEKKESTHTLSNKFIVTRYGLDSQHRFLFGRFLCLFCLILSSTSGGTIKNNNLQNHRRYQPICIVI